MGLHPKIINNDRKTDNIGTKIAVSPNFKQFTNNSYDLGSSN